MFKWLFKNKRKVEELESRLSEYRGYVERLEKELDSLKSYELKYKIAMMYAEDDDAVNELLEMYNDAQKTKGVRQSSALEQSRALANAAAQNGAGLGHDLGSSLVNGYMHSLQQTPGFLNGRRH